MFAVFPANVRKANQPERGSSGSAASPLAGLLAAGVWLRHPALGYLAWDIVGHMALPVATLTLISFAGTMLSDAKQHGRNHA